MGLRWTEDFVAMSYACTWGHENVLQDAIVIIGVKIVRSELYYRHLKLDEHENKVAKKASLLLSDRRFVGGQLCVFHASSSKNVLQSQSKRSATGWWFQKFCVITPTWGNDPAWLISFKYFQIGWFNHQRWEMIAWTEQCVVSPIGGLSNHPIKPLETPWDLWWFLAVQRTGSVGNLPPVGCVLCVYGVVVNAFHWVDESFTTKWLRSMVVRWWKDLAQFYVLCKGHHICCRFGQRNL